MIIKNWQKFLLSLTLIIAVISSLSKFANFSFDLDEIFTINYAESINNLNYTKQFNHDLGNPPLFFFILKPWILISETESWLRILPLIFYLCSILVATKIINQLQIKPKLQFLLIIVLLGIGPYWYLKIYVKAYSLLLLMTLMTIKFTFQIIEEANLINSIKLALVIAIGFNSHYVYWIFFAFWFTTCFVISVKSHKELINKYTINSILTGFIISAPLIFNLFTREIINTTNRYNWWQPKFRISPLDLWEMILKFNLSSFFNYSVGITMWFLFIAATLIIMKKTTQTKHKIFLFFTALFWLAYLLTPLGERLSVQKYIAVFIFLLPITMIIILDKLNIIEKLLNYKIIFIIVVIFFQYWALLKPIEKHNIQGSENWKLVINKIEKELADKDYGIITDCLEAPAFYHYAGEKLNFKLYGTTELASKNDCGMKQITKNSYNFEKIILITSSEVPLLAIQKTHQLVSFSEEYRPIIIATYQKIN